MARGERRKAVLFDEFSDCCPCRNNETADGYGCDHPEQGETVGEDEKEAGCCFCHSCPLGIEAEQQDLMDDGIDWDGLCEDGEVAEGECLLVVSDETATGEQKEALHSYDRHMHRYDKKWLDEHGIANSFVE